MIESSIITRFISDPELCSYIATFNGAPAIFSDDAPETAALPYLLITVNMSPTDAHELQDISVNVDFYDTNKSRSNARKCAERIDALLDLYTLEHERYQGIHFMKFSSGFLPGTDVRDIHYNCQLQAQAVRSKWMTETR